ncbi:phosphate/phosphite/phosphonate ABC transporter substrate-binding protein [Candidatus Poribacteria bacterium]|nr:phosphate/phosphite/phosphonate ABC transporter substrate-binding protein [Candidatus Poribacteria bacterium]
MKKKALICLFLVIALTFPSALTCKSKKPAPEPRATGEKRVFISGSAAVMPLLKTLANEFSKKERDTEIVFLPDSHSEAGIAGTTEEHYDIGAISREMAPHERENPVRYLHLAVDGLVFATNTNVGITNLNSDQIRDIYAGKIANWAQVGGPNAKIAVVDRPEHTSAKLMVRKTFLGESLRVTPEAITVERPWQVSESLQLITHSIGYMSLGEIVTENPPVNIISINGVAPTLSNLKEHRYKFLRPFGLVLGPHPKPSTMRFVNFIFSEEGARVIENSGYVPQRYEILIGLVPEQDVMVQSQRYEPLANYLSQKLGERFSVTLKLFSTYIEACQSLERGDINAAFLGSLAYTTVREHVEVVARPSYGDVSTYRGIIFVRADSGIEGLEQMKGKRLVMGGKTTTAGYVFPLYYFKKNGITDYRRYFSDIYFTGTHEDAILAVLHNKADVGAAKDLIYYMIARENHLMGSNLKILAQSPPAPSNAFVMRKDLELPCFECHQTMARSEDETKNLPSEFNIRSAIKHYLISMDQDPQGREALSALGNATKFVETNDSDYGELYKMLEKIDLKPETLLREEDQRNPG